MWCLRHELSSPSRHGDQLAIHASFVLPDQHAPQLPPGRELSLPGGDPRGAVWLPRGPSGALWWAAERGAMVPASFIRMPGRGWEVTLTSDHIHVVPIIQKTRVRKGTGSVPGRMGNWKPVCLEESLWGYIDGVGRSRGWGWGWGMIHSPPQPVHLQW